MSAQRNWADQPAGGEFVWGVGVWGHWAAVAACDLAWVEDVIEYLSVDAAGHRSLTHR